VKIALLGDIGLFGRFCIVENKNLKEYFSDIAELLSTYDVVIGNLETPFSDTSKTYGAKSAHIVSNKKNIEILDFLNINYVNLSNNHVFDFGLESYELTKNMLQENDIKFFGVESKQCFVEHGEIKLALHGYCSFNTNPQKITFDTSIGINGLDVDIVKKNLQENHDNGFFNIVSIHSGLEHVNYPSQDDIKFARELTNIAPYVYYGHHPHVVQGIEAVDDSILAYSLGNFCFSDVYTNKSKEPLIKQSENNKTGMVLSIELDSNGVSEFKAIPIYMGNVRMKVGDDNVECALEKYTSNLNATSQSYFNMRNELLADFMSERKKMRNLNWFLKRLNLSSVKQIMQSKVNARKYFKHVKSKLK
jgi:poly-gamma-glutamate synthesis protein (capsule biosynthesis protein)